MFAALVDADGNVVNTIVVKEAPPAQVDGLTVVVIDEDVSCSIDTSWTWSESDGLAAPLVAISTPVNMTPPLPMQT